MRLALPLLVAQSLALAVFDVGHDGTFTVKGKHGFVLHSGSYVLHRNNATFSTGDGSLEVKHGPIIKGQDVLGEYREHSFSLSATEDTTVAMGAFIRVYASQEFALFRQHFYPTWSGMSVGDPDRVVSSFPSLKVPETSNLKFINPCWNMAGFFSIQAEWAQANITQMCGGVKGGPFFIFDRVNITDDYLGQTVAVSSFTKHTAWTAEPRKNEGEVWFGLPGLVDKLPSNGYDLSTIISYSDQGFYESVQKWGNILRTHTGKSTNRRASDDTINYLGYWTDNGAFYYYNTVPHKNYEETMLDIYNEVRPNVPFKSWNYDSWFYHKCENSAVKNWTAMHDIFPHGINEIYQQTNMPVIAHNRWWCNETDYADRNGGQYKFLFDDEAGTAVPQDDHFFEDLFKNSTAWGLKVYLQDWMNGETTHLPMFEKDLEIERNWLMQMGDGAKRAGINIMYCMSYSRHMMQSVEIENVVSIRASQDYHPGESLSVPQWDIGLTSIWTYALGLAPFKDTFWTVPQEPGNNYDEGRYEAYHDLEAVMATLSTGIVAISDKIGLTNMTLVDKSIRADGLVLKPSVPVAMPDYMIWDIKLAPASLDKSGRHFRDINTTNIYETYSEVAGFKWGILVLFNPGFSQYKPVSLKMEHYKFSRNQPFDKYFVTHVTIAKGKAEEIRHELWHKKSPLQINDFQELTSDKLTMSYTSHIFELGDYNVGFIGEYNKWVPVSPQRFTGFDQNYYRATISMRGVVNEIVAMRFLVHKKNAPGGPNAYDFSCRIPGSGRTAITLVMTDSDNGKPNIYCQDD